jgi:hypothetical protein
MEVISYRADGSPLAARVVRTHSTREAWCIVVNRTISMTLSQPVFELSGRRVLAGDLRRGMSLRGPSGTSLVIESVQRVRGHFEVATVTTDHATHNFGDRQLIYANKEYVRD